MTLTGAKRSFFGMLSCCVRWKLGLTGSSSSKTIRVRRSLLRARSSLSRQVPVSPLKAECGGKSGNHVSVGGLTHPSTVAVYDGFSFNTTSLSPSFNVCQTASQFKAVELILRSPSTWPPRMAVWATRCPTSPSSSYTSYS